MKNTLSCNLEVKELIKMHVLNGINYGINAGAPQFVVMTAILITLYVQDDHLVPDTLFAYLALMVDVRYYAQMFTLALPYLAEVRIAFDRIQVRFHAGCKGNNCNQ